MWSAMWRGRRVELTSAFSDVMSKDKTRNNLENPDSDNHKKNFIVTLNKPVTKTAQNPVMV